MKKYLFLFFLIVLGHSFSQVRLFDIEHTNEYSRVGFFEFNKLASKQKITIYQFNPELAEWKVEKELPFPENDFPIDIQTGDLNGNGKDEIAALLIKPNSKGYIQIFWDFSFDTTVIMHSGSGFFVSISNILDFNFDRSDDFYVLDNEGKLYFVGGSTNNKLTLSSSNLQFKNPKNFLSLHISYMLDNSNSFFLAVGDPLAYADFEEQGVVDLYKISSPTNLQLVKTLKGSAPFSHYGYKISSANIDAKNGEELVISEITGGENFAGRIYIIFRSKKIADSILIVNGLTPDSKFGFSIVGTDFFKDKIGGLFTSAPNFSLTNQYQKFEGFIYWFNNTNPPNSLKTHLIFGTKNNGFLGCSSSHISKSFLSDSPDILFYDISSKTKFSLLQIFDTSKIQIGFIYVLTPPYQNLKKGDIFWLSLNGKPSRDTIFLTKKLEYFQYIPLDTLTISSGNKKYFFVLGGVQNNTLPPRGKFRFFENRIDTFYYHLDYLTSVSEDNETLFDLTIFPNPTFENLTIEFFSKVSDILNLQILDFEGRVIERHTFNLFFGKNTFHINLANYSNGSYFILANVKEQLIMKRFVIFR